MSNIDYVHLDGMTKEIRVRGRAGSVLADALRDAAILALVENCVSVLEFNGKFYSYDSRKIVNGYKEETHHV